jgi:hypothetical protein
VPARIQPIRSARLESVTRTRLRPMPHIQCGTPVSRASSKRGGSADRRTDSRLARQAFLGRSRKGDREGPRRSGEGARAAAFCLPRGS